MYFVLGKERISNPCIIELNVDIVEDTDLIYIQENIQENDLVL
jgi:hypothetical protein